MLGAEVSQIQQSCPRPALSDPGISATLVGRIRGPEQRGCVVEAQNITFLEVETFSSTAEDTALLIVQALTVPGALVPFSEFTFFPDSGAFA